MSKTLLETTLDKLKNRPAWLTLALIERETGISQYWLSMLNRGKVPNPGIKNIEILANHLNERLGNGKA
jgi:hypothetical protein